MALPVAPNSISISQVSVELLRAANANTNLNEAPVRTLFNKPGANTIISLNDGRGTSAEFTITPTQDLIEINLRNYAVSLGWNQTVRVNLVIGPGRAVYSNNIAVPALTVNGSFPNGVTVFVDASGAIAGKGGNGGAGGAQAGGNAAGATGQNGGLALLVSGTTLTLTNNGFIVGGGGGGNGADQATAVDGKGTPTGTVGGGGGGGGRTAPNTSLGGLGGTGTQGNGNPGGGGSQPGAGAGGAAVAGGFAGGAGGDFGAPGNRFPGQSTAAPVASGGGAIQGNANISYVATGTRLGSIT